MLKTNSNIITRIAAFAIPILWIIFFHPLLEWIFNSYTIHNNWFGMYAAILVIFILIYKSYKKNFKISKQINFQINILPLSIIVFSLISYIISTIYIDIKILGSIFFGFGTYGLAGLYLNKNSWHKLFIPFILIIQTLPFGANLDTYIGFPLRVFTTNTVENLLSGLGIENLRNETIFVIENRAANIDISCSGMKGVWASTIFFLMIVFIQDKKINYKTLIAFTSMIAVLIFFNIIRVSTIIYTDTVLNMQKLAEMIHVPLGIIGFVFSLATAWFLINFTNNNTTDKLIKKSSLSKKKIKHQIQISALLSITLLLLIFIDLENKEISRNNNIKQITIDANIKLKPAELSENEKILMITEKNDVSQKYTFDTLNLKGSILISKTTNWRGHHKPEICYTADGFDIKNSKTISIGNKFYIREITFKNCDYTAFYWFQSGNKITYDYSSRVWEALTTKNKNWTMISAIISKNTDIETRNKFFSDIKIQLAKNI